MPSSNREPRQGQKARWTPTRFTLLVALAHATALAGCGGSSGDAAGDQPGDAPGAPSAPAVSPSFDCGEASGEIEELICSTPDLAVLDLRLDSVWQEVESQLSSGTWPESGQAFIRTEQRGWIEGRNGCWTAEDPEACVTDEYVRRTVTLRAQFALAEVGEPTFWGCDGNAANEFVLTFVSTDPESVRVERGDRQEVMIRIRAASGARYQGTFGKEVWVQGEEGMFVWPQEDTLSCELRPSG